MVEALSELGTTLAVTSYCKLIVTTKVVPSLLMFYKVMMGAKRRFLQEPQAIAYLKAAFFIIHYCFLTNNCRIHYSLIILKSILIVSNKVITQRINYGSLTIQQNIRFNKTNKQTPWPLVRERTIPTERPPLVDEI
jgi:hypothetical protein